MLYYFQDIGVKRFFAPFDTKQTGSVGNDSTKETANYEELRLCIRGNLYLYP